MSTKDFKAGMVAGAKPFEEKFEKLGQKVDNQNRDLIYDIQESFENMYNNEEYKEKMEAYGLKEQLDIRNLEQSESYFLVSALYTLSLELEFPSDLQKRYLSMVRKCLKIIQLQEIDLHKIDAINDLNAQKVILRVVMEYIYLGNRLWGFTDIQKNFLESFNLNKASKENIQKSIECEVKTIGFEGIVEKYDIKNDNDNEGQLYDFNKEETIFQKEGYSNLEEPLNENSTNNQRNANKYEDYRMVQSIIRSRFFQIFSSESKEKKQNSQKNRIIKFKEKYAPDVVEETIISLAEVYLVKILFTTCGMRILPFLEKKPLFIRYADIDLKTSRINYSKNSAKAESITLVKTGTNEEIKIEAVEIDFSAFLDMITEISNYPMALYDTPILIKSMSDEVKLPYAKILIKFCQNNNLDIIEALRFSNDLEMSKMAFENTLDFAQANFNGVETKQLLFEMLKEVPYPSNMSVRYALVQDLVAVLQYTTGRTRDITAEERKFIRNVALDLVIEDSVLNNLIPFAQIPYRIIKGDITKKEIGALGQTLATVAAGVGLPIATIVGSSLLYWNVMWFMFIPGVGSVIAAAVVGITAVTAIVKKVNDSSSDLEKERKEQNDNVIKSYLRLGRVIESIPNKTIADAYINRLIESLSRTNDYIEYMVKLQLI